MDPIPVNPHPIRKVYDSFEAAFVGTSNDPSHIRAKAEVAFIKGSTLVDGTWSMGAVRLAFSNGRVLNIFVEYGIPAWHWMDDHQADNELQFTGNSPPLKYDWGEEVGLEESDVGGLIQERIGVECTLLDANDSGFYLYFKGRKALSFYAAYRADTGDDVLSIAGDV